MAPRLQILSNVIERLKNLNESATGHLYGVMYKNTLTVLTFTLDVSDDTEFGVNYANLQLSMPAEVYLYGILYLHQPEEKTPDMFQDIDITDNPLFMRYSKHEPEIQSYFYIHQKLEHIDEVEIVNLEDISQQFVYIRLQGTIPLSAQTSNAMEVLEETRRNVASGKIGFNFPLNEIYIFNNENKLKDTSLKELLNMSEKQNGREKTQSPGIVDAIDADILLKISGDKNSEENVKYAPVLQYVKRPFESFECDLHIDAISLINTDINTIELHGALVESLCRNIKLVEKCIEELQKTECSEKLPVPLHFKLQDCGHLFTVVYPPGAHESETVEYRKSLHKALALDLTRPYFRYGNAVQFSGDVQNDAILINPHQAISQNNEKGSLKISTVKGLYAYHHYMQDNFDDSGWGCAYRSLQSIVSWFRLQGYTDVPVPSHQTIQKCLVDIGDKPHSFIGSKDWIGSTEVGFVLQSLLNITVRVLYVSTGEKMPEIVPDLLHHFDTQGTPVMIGGGVLAHTILGVSYDEITEEIKFLILDPHYTGTEHLPTIINKGWCGWKSKDFWRKDTFYNMCLPQRPVCI